MSINQEKYIKLFLRASLSSAFISAVFDRLGWWPEEVSAWGNWENFLAYTQVLNPWFPEGIISVLGLGVTVAELVFGLCLAIGFKTSLFAKLSGVLLLLFATFMTITIGVKAPLDYSVFTASAAAFALSTMHRKYWELDSLFA